MVPLDEPLTLVLVEPTARRVEAAIDAWLDSAADPRSRNGQREIVATVWRAMMGGAVFIGRRRQMQ
jgi:hypothetical protein